MATTGTVGECTNMYLHDKLKTNDYVELMAQLTKLVSKKNVNVSKIITVLQKLCLYTLELDLIPTLLNCMCLSLPLFLLLISHICLVLQFEDRKLLRLVYLHLAGLATTHNERGRYMDQIQERLRADVATGGMRAIMAIKTFAGYHYAMTGQSMLYLVLYTWIFW